MLKFENNYGVELKRCFLIALCHENQKYLKFYLTPLFFSLAKSLKGNLHNIG